MPLPEVQRPNADFLLERMVNFNSAAEGSILPPKQLGANRVPPVTRFRLISVLPDVNGNRVTLAWEEPQIYTSNNTSYNIYASGLVPGSSALTGPYNFTTSPGVILLPPSPAATNITFHCQTVLASGFTTNLENCPTVSSLLLPPVLYATSADLRYPVYNQQGLGVATLSGGTVTVTSSVITADSKLLLSRQSVSGTPGHLYLGTITPYTSFEILSTSGTDASAVLWAILNPVTA